MANRNAIAWTPEMDAPIGTNLPENLVTLCDSCHHAIEATTNRALESIRVDVSLEGSTLTVMVDEVIRWRGSARGAVSPTANG